MAEWTGIESPVSVDALKKIGKWYGYTIENLRVPAHSQSNSLFSGTSGNIPFVVKVNSNDDAFDAKTIQDELAWLTSFDRHVNIIEVLTIPGLKGYIVMPRYSMTLTSFLCPGNIHTVKHVSRIHIMIGIVDAMLFLVARCLVHGDVKSDNILISDSGVPVLADFGVCRPADKDAPTCELLDKMMLITNYTIENGVGMQAVGMNMFATDAIRGVTTLLAVLDIIVKVQLRENVYIYARRTPIDLAGATLKQMHIYNRAISDITLVSEVIRTHTNPMRQPRNAAFANEIIRNRLESVGPFGAWCIKQRIVQYVITTMVMFNRHNVMDHAEISWFLLKTELSRIASNLH